MSRSDESGSAREGGAKTSLPTRRSSRAVREIKRHRLHREARRVHLLRAAGVGLLAGVLAVLFELAVQEAEHIGGVAASWAEAHPSFGPGILLAGCFAIGAAAAHLIGVYSPESGGSGIPHIKAALLHLRIIRPVRILVAKFLGGLAALAVGMSLGREGPTVQMGAAAGRLLGSALGTPKRSRSALVAAGAGAGLAAAFNAPLAGFLFVMEELKREMSAITYASALIASVCSVAVTRYLIGEKPSFTLPDPGGAPLLVLPAVALVGVVAGLAGVLFNKSLIWFLDLRVRHTIPRWIYGGFAALASGACLIEFPGITGGGHGMAENLLSGGFQHVPNLLLFVLLVFAGKLLLTSLSYGTGLPGGIFAPILVMGSFLGYAGGLIVRHYDPGIGFSVEGFATIGMAALLSGSVRAPLTGVVLIVEMTAEYGLLYALLVGSFAAYLVAEGLRDKPIYEALMERDLHLDGAEIHSEEEPILIEVLVEPSSSMDGARVKNLHMPPGAIVSTLERGSRHIVPGGATILQAGDMITVMVEGDKPELSVAIHEAARAP